MYAWIEATAEMSDERREAYEAFIENGNEPEQFDECYMGSFGDRPYDDDFTATCYAEDQWFQGHDESAIPSSLRNYVDWKSMGNDLVLGGEIFISNGHVFLNR